MQITKKDVNSAAHELAVALLSRDQMIFNACVNTHFAAHSIYKGHGLTVRGASNIKHVAHLFNAVDLGRRAVVDESSWHWDESTQTATFTSLRFLRPLVFPLFEYALPVKTMLRFESPRGFDQPTQDDSKEELLLVAEFKDEWVAERLLSFAPKFVQQAFWSTISPLVSTIIIALSTIFVNLVFRFNKTTKQAYHNVVEPANHSHTAQRVVPQTVKDGLNRGLNDGMNLAEGVGEKAVGAVLSVAKTPLQVLEWTAIKSTSLANNLLPSLLALPTPYIFSHADDGVYSGTVQTSRKRPASDDLDPASITRHKRHEGEKAPVDGADKTDPAKPLPAAPSAELEAEAEADGEQEPAQNDSNNHSPVVPQAQLDSSREGDSERRHAAHTSKSPSSREKEEEQERQEVASEELKPSTESSQSPHPNFGLPKEGSAPPSGAGASHGRGGGTHGGPSHGRGGRKKSKKRGSKA